MVSSTAFLRALAKSVAHPETTLDIILPFPKPEQAGSSPHRFRKAIHTKQAVPRRTNSLIFIDRTREVRRASRPVVACVIFAAGSCLPRSCLATIGAINMQTHMHTDSLLLFSKRGSRLVYSNKLQFSGLLDSSNEYYCFLEPLDLYSINICMF